jgi:hypothetical protein
MRREGSLCVDIFDIGEEAVVFYFDHSQDERGKA